MKIRFEKCGNNSTLGYVNLDRGKKAYICAIRRTRFINPLPLRFGYDFRWEIAGAKHKFARRCDAKRFVEARVANLVRDIKTPITWWDWDDLVGAQIEEALEKKESLEDCD